MKKITLLLLISLISFAAFSADYYWKGSGTLDNLDDNGNWYAGSSHPSSGDNLYFNNTVTKHWAYSNYGLGSYFGFIITYNGAGGIKLYGDNTYAYKFENNSDGSLFELSPSSDTAGSREIGNRINSDLEINPVGSGGILVSCDKISMDNTNGVRGLKVYGGNTLTVNGIIYEKNGTGSTLQLLQTATVELKGNSTFTGLTTITGGTLKLNAAGGALNSGNAVTISGGTLEITQSQIIGDLTMSSGTLKVNAGQTLTIIGTYSASGGTIDNQGTIILQGSASQAFPGSSVAINNGTADQMSNLTINNTIGVSIDKTFTAANVIANPGSKLDINSGVTLTTTNFTLQSNTSGVTATLKNNGTLTATTTNVEQYLELARNWYLSSPLTNAVTSSLIHYKYLEDGSNTGYVSPATAYWASVATGTTMTPALGFVAQAANASTYTFTTNTGSLNNGDVTTPTLKRTPLATKPGFNLIGNPYPSYLDINSFSSSTLIDPTYWIRSKNGGYVFDTYNIPSNLSTGLSGKTVSRYIPPMQAFWVRLKTGQTTGTLTFTNAMRAHIDDAGNTFRAPSQQNKVGNKILRLEVQSNANVDEALIYFNPNAADNFDNYDSPKWFNLIDTIPEIYTVTDAEKLVINGFNTIQFNTEIPLGFRTGNTDENHNFKLKASQLQNFGTETELVLIDRNGSTTETVLNEGTEYTFNSLAVNSTNRFSLVFRTKGTTTGGLSYGTYENKIRVQKNENNQIVVFGDNAVLKNATIAVYNAAGQKLLTQHIQNATTTLLPAFKAGVYLIKVQSEGKIYNVKVAI